MTVISVMTFRSTEVNGDLRDYIPAVNRLYQKDHIAAPIASYSIHITSHINKNDKLRARLRKRVKQSLYAGMLLLKLRPLPARAYCALPVPAARARRALSHLQLVRR